MKIYTKLFVNAIEYRNLQHSVAENFQGDLLLDAVLTNNYMLTTVYKTSEYSLYSYYKVDDL